LCTGSCWGFFVIFVLARVLFALSPGQVAFWCLRECECVCCCCNFAFYL
jgi:hypothetical protein